MGSLTDFAELKLLDHIFENTAYTPVAQLYLALFVTDPTDAGVVTSEPSTNGYARASIAFSAASGRKIVQNGQVTFPQCTGGDWGIISYWGIMDAASSGNMLAYGAFSTPITTAVGNVPFVPNLSIEVSVDPGAISNYLAHALLNFMFRNIPYAQPNIHIALCDAAPLDTDTGSTISELSGNAYARVDFGDWTAAVAGALSNNTDINFITPTGAWNLITHSAILDASTAGNLLFYAEAFPNQAPQSGDPVKFIAGAYDVSLD